MNAPAAPKTASEIVAEIAALSSRIEFLSREQQVRGYDANRAYETRVLVSRRSSLLAVRVDGSAR